MPNRHALGFCENIPPTFHPVYPGYLKLSLRYNTVLRKNENSITSPYTVTTKGLQKVGRHEWNQFTKELKEKKTPLNFFTIGSGDSDSPEARSFSVYLSVEQNLYWLLPHTPENPEQLVFGPIKITQATKENQAR